MNTPWGNARATYRARGIKLPPRDSVEDKIMVEMLFRERLEKLTAWELGITAQGLFTMADGKAVSGIVRLLKNEYKEFLFQEAYTTRAAMRRLFKSLHKAKETADRMEQLDKLTKLTDTKV